MLGKFIDWDNVPETGEDVRTPQETAAYMLQRYGREAAVHCSYAIMNNREKPAVRAYWEAVLEEIKRKET